MTRLRLPIFIDLVQFRVSLLPPLQIRALQCIRGNEDGSDMHVIVLNAINGQDLLSAPVSKNLPCARHLSTVHVKTNVVNDAGTTCGRFPFGLQFPAKDACDKFEQWLTKITGTTNCFLCCAPSTAPLLSTVHEQVAQCARSPPPEEKVIKRGRKAASSPRPKNLSFADKENLSAAIPSNPRTALEDEMHGEDGSIDEFLPCPPLPPMGVKCQKVTDKLAEELNQVIDLTDGSDIDDDHQGSDEASEKSSESKQDAGEHAKWQGDEPMSQKYWY